MSRKLVVLLSISLIISLMSGCETETLVTKVDPAKPHTQGADGVLFSLPETLVVSEVPLTRVTSNPGVYSKWTQLFYPELTDDQYITKKKVVLKLGTPTFTTRGQTDPHNVYIAHIKAKSFETKALLLEFNEDGIIARTEASSKDETIDIVTSGIKTVASFVAPLVGTPFSERDTFNKSGVVGVDCKQRAAEAAAANAAARAATEVASKHPKSIKLAKDAETLKK